MRTFYVTEETYEKVDVTINCHTRKEGIIKQLHEIYKNENTVSEIKMKKIKPIHCFKTF